MATNSFYQNGLVPEGSELAGKRILFANVPADGHFNPLTSLAVHLLSLGYDVRWYTSSLYENKVRKLGIPFYPFREAKEIDASNLDLAFPERTKINRKIAKLNFDVIHFFVARAPEYYADMMEIRKEFPFDLVIADCGFAAIPFITEKIRVPAISIGVLPLVASSRDLPPSGLGMKPSRNFLGRIKQDLLRFMAFKILFRKSNVFLHRQLDEYGIPHQGENVFDMVVRKSTLLLQSGTHGFEYERSDLSPHIHFIGPLLPYSSPKKKIPWFHPKLNRYERVILVTQGTVEKDISKLIIPTLEAFRETEVLVVATTGGSGTCELRERFRDDNYIIEDFVPFDDIMPYADAYITNGGYGGVMLAIENNLPMVVAGIHEGKNEINARIDHFRLGINLATERPSSEQIRKATREIFANPVYRANVIRLAAEFACFDPLRITADKVAGLLGQPMVANREKNVLTQV
ncbi:glycosyltransferase [Flavihumibacter rivuli]|uniref:glycosyltransferase n=1 Tax=Flavihumibacter rivuli TaxID=2838156 RepID=UPI001BDEDBAE|nr:glycosyltransferase [Flavihumibacter rivuli]ULQ57698.1 glycosyltransferase [Flavihumibacter rivuli]